MLEADDGFLKTRMKEFPADKVKEPHWEDKEMDRRLKAYRDANSGAENVTFFFENVIGKESCLKMDGPDEIQD